MNNYHPPIVVVAFNRPNSLKRLLSSLQRLKNAEHVKLIISIDNLEPVNLNVKEIADSFIWPFGEKEVIYQKERLGLRKHILKCGDLSEKYDSVIILEDDLYVSPYIYEYTVKALEYYGEDEKIAGISLYNQPYEETSQRPFSPLIDDSDVYFVQFPSSLGQAWTRNQWRHFRSWYDLNPQITSLPIPPKISRWPETSWKKYFCAYLVDLNRFFVFPRISYTTNFNDPGTNMTNLINHDGQVQINLLGTEYRLKKIQNSNCIYDVYFELMPYCVKNLSDEFNGYSFEFDLYGNKNLSKVQSEYIITSRPARASVKGYKRALKPHEINVITNLSGNEFTFCKKEDVMKCKNINDKRIADFKYFYKRNLLGWKVIFRNYLNQLFRK